MATAICRSGGVQSTAAGNFQESSIVHGLALAVLICLSLQQVLSQHDEVHHVMQAPQSAWSLWPQPSAAAMASRC